MADSKLALSPREFSGDPATCVYGRVVIVRGPVELGNQEKAKGKGKAKGKNKGQEKGKDKGPGTKIEVHLLGGDTAGDVLFIDAWADAAGQVSRALELGKVYRISGGTVVNQTPKYSTSRLSYFLRVKPPLGVNTIIQECTEGPLTELPLHHPFADIAILGKVTDAVQVCAVGVVSHQPGVVERDTPYGRAGVCNAVIKQGRHDIRCGFWRNHAAALAAFPVGSTVALMQVNVKQLNGSWELFATEATQIKGCPADLAAAVSATTDVTDGAEAATSLSKRHAVDYDTAPAIASTVSGLMSVPVPFEMRDLPGVFELHCVAVTGVAGASADSDWQIRSCVECKKKIPDGQDACGNHPNAGTELRWLLKLGIADNTGGGSVVMYHDAVASVGVLGESAELLDAQARRLRAAALRATPWTLRCIFKTNDASNVNYLEVKRMVPTLTSEGVIATWTQAAGPAVKTGGACPFAKCGEVTSEESLGLLFVGDCEVKAVRVLLVMQRPSDQEIVAVPDAENRGLRVQRLARCGLQPDSETRYVVKTAGVAGDVQWLLTSGHGDAHLVTATMRTDKTSGLRTFEVLSHAPVAPELLPSMTNLMAAVTQSSTSALIAHAQDATPLKRLREIAVSPEDAPAPSSLTTRRRLD